MTFSGRNWYEIYLLLLTVGWAVLNWVTGADGEMVAAAFPGWGRHVFFGGLIAGSVLALAGIARGTMVGLLVERAALFTLAGVCAMFGLAVLTQADVIAALYVVPLLIGYAAVHLVRAAQARRDVTRIRRTLTAQADPGATA